MNKKRVIAIIRFAVCGLVLPVTFSLTGCSKKNDQSAQQESNEATSPSPAVPQQSEANLAPKETQSHMASVPSTSDNEPNKEAVAHKMFPSTDMKMPVADIIAKFKTTGSSSLKLEMLESLDELALSQDPNVITVVLAAVGDPNADVSRAAIALLSGYEGPQILPAVSEALKSNDEQTRQDALDLLYNVDDPNVGVVVLAALNDPSEDVRTADLDLALQQEGEAAVAIMKHGISSQYPDVKQASVAMLQDKGNREAVDILITGLKDKDAEFRNEVSSALSMLIDKQFETYEEAQTWWAQNRDKFDDDLTPVSTDSN
jgi:hypothetical protein